MILVDDIGTTETQPCPNWQEIVVCGAIIAIFLQKFDSLVITDEKLHILALLTHVFSVRLFGVGM